MGLGKQYMALSCWQQDAGLGMELLVHLLPS